MKKINQLVLIILLACTSPLSADESVPQPFEASFKIVRNGMEVAEMHSSLSRLDNDDYIYRSETNSTGLASIFYKLHVVEESHWYLHEQQIKPLSYSYDRIKKKKEKHKNTVFDWKNMQAHYVGDGTKSSFELQAGMTDKLLYQINLMHDLKTGHPPTSYTVVDGAKIKTYKLKYLGEEFIDTPIGKFKTMKFSRHKSGNKDRITLWCAEDLYYLPIKVESIDDDDGSVTIATIKQLTGLGLSDEIGLSDEVIYLPRALSNSSGGK
jgi:hypothetical protein